MKKIIKFLILSCTLCLIFSISACKPKKKKRNLIEVNPISTGTEIKNYGAQPQRGSDPNAPVVITSPIYIPLGMDENGKRQYEKVFVELEELKPEYIDEGKKGIVRYLDLGTDLDNSDNYKDVTDTKKLKGKIDYDDIMHCILATFQENFQLVDCEFNPM